VEDIAHTTPCKIYVFDGLKYCLFSYFFRNGMANIYDQQVTVSFFSLSAQLTASVSQGLAETFQNKQI